MSRTEAIRSITAGEVRIAGRVVRDPGYPTIPERDAISVNGRAVTRKQSITILLHKPRGTITTRRDPEGRATVFDLLPADLPYLAPVGRLDRASTGLLLLTNDTRLGHWLLNPANAIPRTYIVTVRGELSDASAARMEQGVRDHGELLKVDTAEILKRSTRETHLRVTLAEGKNRELRRLFSACGSHELTRLKRIAFGELTLGTLAPGKWRVVAAAELARAFPAVR